MAVADDFRLQPRGVCSYFSRLHGSLISASSSPNDSRCCFCISARPITTTAFLAANRFSRYFLRNLYPSRRTSSERSLSGERTDRRSTSGHQCEPARGKAQRHDRGHQVGFKLYTLATNHGSPSVKEDTAACRGPKSPRTGGDGPSHIRRRSPTSAGVCGDLSAGPAAHLLIPVSSLLAAPGNIINWSVLSGGDQLSGAQVAALAGQVLREQGGGAPLCNARCPLRLSSRGVRDLMSLRRRSRGCRLPGP